MFKEITCRESIERIKDILATDCNNLKPKDVDVAKALRIHPNNLAQAKFQNRIPYKAIMDFLHSKNISINTFFYGTEPKETAKSSERYKILRLYMANASAGGGCMNDEMSYREVMIDKQILDFLHIESCEMIFVIGDSMEEAIADNSLCLISRQESEIKNGKVYAVNTLDGLFVKQCFVKDEMVELRSFNQNYKPIIYPLNEVIVLGRIKGAINKI
ncbi:S24 family peptidase [Helicobacter sp. MIT 05-5293]|uniref:S24 family peptidase n=1 Tax=Helicobacter sp. MIT 05-5293 TaxID=1548149 RepID=UPI00068FBD32|nr:S24 family peptidase [Helicobacter sp. MIT 05-5293]TLD80143.1 S24 family peptidase [Helicobacter sp. MIT 05-5293]